MVSSIIKYANKLSANPRLDKRGNIASLGIRGYFHQRIIESGYAMPWTMRQQPCVDYWASKTDTNWYDNKDDGIVKFLNDFWTPQVLLPHSILELGCNSGANLYYLSKMGYDKLAGIEVNRHAVEMMQRGFPDLYRKANIYVGSIEGMLPWFGDSSIDVIFTMATLQHIHPSSNGLFKEIVRVAKKFICVIETEHVSYSCMFPRNYRRVFSKLGWHQIKSALITDVFSVSSEYYGYVARLFVKR